MVEKEICPVGLYLLRSAATVSKSWVPIVKVDLGDTARIEIDAYTDRDFLGVVTDLSAVTAGTVRMSVSETPYRCYTSSYSY